MDLGDLRRVLRGEIFTDGETLSGLVSDFGGVRRGTPSAVLLPADEADVQHIVRFAFDHRLSLVTRGAGHSQGGQSVGAGGLMIDTSNLNRIGPVEKESVWVQAGALWSRVVRRTLEQKLLPPILTNYLEVSVGGTLSAGGFGTASHRFGAQVEHVLQLEVVTGEGHRVRCSARENPELFRCVRGGLGQFGIITGAKLRLRKTGPRVRTHYLLYDDLQALMLDQQRWVESRRVDHIDCCCSPCPQGLRRVGQTRLPFAEWFYPVQLSIEFHRHSEHVALPSGLHFYRSLGHEDSTIEEFAFQVEPLFEFWRHSGSWQAAHPWMEVFLPWSKAAAYVRGVLRSFPSNLLEGGQVQLWPLPGVGATAPMLRMPAGQAIMGFGLKPAVRQQSLPLVLPMISKAAELSSQVGGKRYLSGWLDFDRDGWKSHFGELWPSVLEWKRFYDPRGILNPGVIQFPDRETEP